MKTYTFNAFQIPLTHGNYADFDSTNIKFCNDDECIAFAKTLIYGAMALGSSRTGYVVDENGKIIFDADEVL